MVFCVMYGGARQVRLGLALQSNRCTRCSKSYGRRASLEAAVRVYAL